MNRKIGYTNSTVGDTTGYERLFFFFLPQLSVVAPLPYCPSLSIGSPSTRLPGPLYMNLAVDHHFHSDTLQRWIIDGKPEMTCTDIGTDGTLQWE